MTAGLTPKHAKLLKLIADLTVDGVPPRYEALAEAMQTSRGNIHRLLTGLKARGYVTWNYASPRSLRLVDPLAGKSNGELLAMRNRIDALLVERIA